MQAKAGLGEQTLNKIAEMALASQLQEVEQLEVRIKTDLTKLARGEVDAIAIQFNGLVIEPNLRIEELHLLINRVTVKPLGALVGKIKLTRPSTGTVRAIFNEEDLTRAFNSKSFHKRLHQMSASVETKQLASALQQVKCDLLADSKIAINYEMILDKTKEAQRVTFTTTPRIGTDGQGIVLQDVHYVEGKEHSPQLTMALVAQVGEALSLRDFARQGMSLRVQQLDVEAGKLTLQTVAHIEQFPSS